MRRRRRGGPGPGGRRRDERNLGEWVPKTSLGRMVLAGEITTLGQALETGLPLREPEIVDILLPETEDEVLDVNMVQRMTDSGRRVNFAITVVVGNKDGFVGLGRARGSEVGPAIRRAIDNAKVNITAVRRGCGSWQCGCRRAHTLPMNVSGRSGSVRVTLRPAPQGVGLAVGDIAKSILRLGGIQDAWGFTRGHTKTTVNYAIATFEAIQNTGRTKVSEELSTRLRVHTGAEQVFTREVAPEPPKEDGDVPPPPKEDAAVPPPSAPAKEPPEEPKTEKKAEAKPKPKGDAS